MKRFFYSILISMLLVFSVKASTETAETIYAKAYGNLYKGNTHEAIRILDKAISTYPDCAFLYAGMGDAYLKEGNFDKAINYYTIAQRQKYAIDIYKIDFYNATLQKNMKDIQVAVDTLISTTKISDNPTLFLNIKHILNENYAKTTLITDIYYNSEDEELTRINNLRLAGNKEEALKGYLKLLSANPKNFQAANNAGVTFFDLKDYQLAEKYLKTALDINKEAPLILNNLAIVNLYQKNYNDMENNFNEALKLKSDYIPAINNKVIANIHRDLDFFQAQNIDSILDIIKKDNENYYAMRTLAKIYTVKGDYDNANNILLPLNSTYNFKLYTQKAYVALKYQDYNNALLHVNKAISLYSDNSIDYLLRARILTALARYGEAQADFQKALEKNRKNVTVYYYQARMFNKYGNTETANTFLKKYFESKKGNTQSANLRKILLSD